MSAVKRSCRKCKAHNICVAMHASCNCPFNFCKCEKCEKISTTNEIARERARKRRAEEAAVADQTTKTGVTVKDVINLANQTSAEEDRKKHLSDAKVQAGKLRVQFVFKIYM